MQASDLQNRFTFHPVKDEAQGQLYSDVRQMAHALALWLDDNAPDSRELSLAMTHLEEVVFWTNAAIARHSGE